MKSDKKNRIEFRLYISTFIIGLVMLMTGCKTVVDVNGHDINKGGAMHKTGLTNPEVNCISCHGSDLRGSGSAPSCFNCHGKKW